MREMDAFEQAYKNGYAAGMKAAEEKIVRCWECKYWQDNNGGYPHDECRWGNGETPDEQDFCSYGERRRND